MTHPPEPADYLDVPQALAAEHLGAMVVVYGFARTQVRAGEQLIEHWSAVASEHTGTLTDVHHRLTGGTVLSLNSKPILPADGWRVRRVAPVPYVRTAVGRQS